MEISVTVEYVGLIAKLAARGLDHFTLPEGASVETLLQEIMRRHAAIARGKGAFFIAVNKKAIPANQQARQEQILSSGDRVTLAVKIIGG